MALKLDLAPRGSLTAYIEDQLRAQLMCGALRPGERLVTRPLAQQLGTSPTPVREALLKLVAAGALDAAPAQSFQVPVVTRERYLEMSRIRKALEGLAAEEATQRIDEAGRAELAGLNDRFRAAKAAGDVRAALKCNQAFRFTLYRSAAMPTLLELIETVWLRIGPCFNYLYPAARLTGGRHNYDEVLEALAVPDAARVRRAVERAIDDGTAILMDSRYFNGYLQLPSDLEGDCDTPPTALP